MRSRIARAALLGAGLAVAGAPLAAQQAAHGHQPPDTAAGGRMRDTARTKEMTGGCPLMSVMMRGPAAALRARDALGLSQSQVQRLEAVKRRVDQAHARSMDSMHVLHPRIAALVDAPRFDEGATRATLDRMARLHVDVGVAMFRAQHETADILTPQQRDSLMAIGRAQMGAARNTKPGAGAAAGADPCAGMMAMGQPGARPPGALPDSVDDHAPRADSTRRRP